MTIPLSDPRLTAFVLGEVSEDDAKEIQTAINNDAALQNEIEAIRQTVAQIETVMKNEPLEKPTSQTPTRTSPRLLRWTSVAVAASLLCAASVWVAMQSSEKETAKVVPHIADVETLAVAPTAALDAELDDTLGAKTDSFAGEERKEIRDLPAEAKQRRALADREMQQVEKKEQAVFTKDMSSPLSAAAPPPVREPQSMEQNAPAAAAKPEADAAFYGFCGGVEVQSTGQTRALYEGSDKSRGMMGGMSGSGAMGGASSMSSGSEMMSRRSGSMDGLGMGSGTLAGKPGMPMEMSEGRITATNDLAKRMVRRDEPESEILERRAETEKSKISADPYVDAKDEAYKKFAENEFTPVKSGEFSTFSIDVDTAAYSVMRRFVEAGQKPPADAVRLEEYINYFRYNYAQPTDGKPFAVNTAVAACPWEPKHLLARIGIKGKEYSTDERPPLNLVFLIDVSGSMSSSLRLPLVKRGLTELVEMLQPKDRVAIVTYAGASKVALPSVSGQEKQAILDSLESLTAGGSTAGAEGIKTAYETARKYYDEKAQNRVVLCTDGDFNVGVTDNGALETMIGDEAKSGVFLTILGFGMGNYKDERLKTLSMRGNGNYGYIDSLEECRKLLVEGLSGTLFAIAKDVKIQVDFNPANVAGYRLLGYENRKLRDEDFHNDKIDAGEIGAGHTVTALYEIVPAGMDLPGTTDKSRYAEAKAEEKPTEDSKQHKDELLFVKLRYKEPKEDKSTLLEYPVSVPSDGSAGFEDADARFAAAAALYGMLLRDSRYSGSGDWKMVKALAESAMGDDSYRKEFLQLVEKASTTR